MLVRLAGWSFGHRWTVIGAWVLVVVLTAGIGGAVGTAFDDALEIPDSGTKDGFDALDEHFGGVGAGQSGQIVFTADGGVDQGDVRRAMEPLFAEVDGFEGVIIESPYAPGGDRLISDDGRTAYAVVNLDLDIDQTQSGEIGKDIKALRPDLEGLQVEVGGQALQEFKPPDSELIGIAFAVVILIVAFGSVLGMGLPVGVAAASVGTGVGLIGLLSNVQTMPEFATTIGAMIGLGVGIDYALFIVTRYREALHEGHDGLTSVRIAADTAGRAVMFAGVTVVVSLLGMLLIGLAFVAGLGIGAATVVAVTMAASITLLPALLGLAGDRIEVTRWRGLIAAGLVALALLGIGLGLEILVIGLPLAVVVMLAGFAVRPLRATVPERRTVPVRETRAYRWSRTIQHHPWAAVLGGSAILLTLSLPILGLRLGFSDESNAPEGSTTRAAYEMLADGFGPGYAGPLLVVAEVGSSGDGQVVADLTAELVALDGVAEVTGPLPSDFDAPQESAAFLINVIPDSGPQSAETEALLGEVRDTVVPAAVEGTGLDVNVTGFVAASADFTDYLSERILIFFAVVLALSFLLLMVVFRSLLVPLKAVILNVLSISAAYGVVVAVFQWGWGSTLTGVDPAPIEPFIPMMMFAIVFGLSMDYEVFLLSRVKEEYTRTGDSVTSVADGLAATARVITAAAAIMVVVFGSFMLEDDRVIQLFGLGLATAILLDATLVRMVLVPATMELLGDRNWWLPAWLDRMLPQLNVEGDAEAIVAEAARADGDGDHAGGGADAAGPSDRSAREAAPV